MAQQFTSEERTELQRQLDSGALTPEQTAAVTRVLGAQAPPLTLTTARGEVPASPPPALPQPESMTEVLLGTEPPGPRLSLGQRALSMVPEAGQIATGAVAGAKLAARRTPVGMLGVGLAESLFEAGQMGVEAISGRPPETPAIAIDRLVGAFTEGAIGEVLGRGVVKAAAPFRAATEVASGLEAARLVTERQPRAPLSPLRLFGPDKEVVQATIPQLTGRLQLADNIISGAILGKGARTQVLKDQADLLSSRTLDFITAVGGPGGGRRVAGMVYKASLDAAVEAFEVQKRALYTRVDELTAGVRVDMSTAAVRAGELLAQRGTLVEDVASDPLAKMLRRLAAKGKGINADLEELIVGKTIMTKGGPAPLTTIAPKGATTIGDLPEGLREALRAAAEYAPDAAGDVTFRHAQNLRSFLLARERQFTQSGDRNAAAIYGQVAKAVDEAMEASANQLAPEGIEAFRTANKFFKEEGIDKFYSDFSESLQDSLASEISKKLTAPGIAPELVEQARELVGPERFLQMRAQLLEEIVRDKKGDLVSGDKLLSELGTRREALREFFPDGADQDIWRLARVKQELEGRLGGGTGKMWIQFAQAGAAGAVFTGGITLGLAPAAAVGATTILLGPALLSRVLNAPLARKWLTVGLAAGPGTELSARAATQVLTVLTGGEASVEEPPGDVLESIGGEPPGPRPMGTLPLDPRMFAAPPPGPRPG